MDDPNSHSRRIVALHDRGVTIDDLAFNLRYANVPYAASDLRTPSAQTTAVVASTPQRPAAKVPARAEFKVGDRVTFNDRDNLPITGSVSRVNQKTVTVTPDNMVGRWRVWAALVAMCFSTPGFTASKSASGAAKSKTTSSAAKSRADSNR